jgi:hypothetical protein
MTKATAPPRAEDAVGSDERLQCHERQTERQQTQAGVVHGQGAQPKERQQK